MNLTASLRIALTKIPARSTPMEVDSEHVEGVFPCEGHARVGSREEEEEHRRSC